MTLSNDIISIEVNEHGAELVSIKKVGFLSGSPAFFCFRFGFAIARFFLMQGNIIQIKMLFLQNEIHFIKMQLLQKY